MFIALTPNNKLLTQTPTLIITATAILLIRSKYYKFLANSKYLQILLNIKYLYTNKSKLLFVLAISTSVNLFD